MRVPYFISRYELTFYVNSICWLFFDYMTNPKGTWTGQNEFSKAIMIINTRCENQNISVLLLGASTLLLLFFFNLPFFYANVIYILEPSLCSKNKSSKKTQRRSSVTNGRALRLLLIAPLTFNNSLSKNNEGKREGICGVEIASCRTEMLKVSQIILGERSHLNKESALQKQKTQQ